MLNSSLLAENIRKFRKRAGLTETAVAKALFVTPQTVSKWEKQIAVPDLGNLTALAEALNVTPNELLGYETGQNRIRKGIGIDGGGTKTDFVLFDETGAVRKRMILGSSNPSTVGFSQAAETLRNGIDRILASEPRVEGIYMGLAGLTAGDNASAFYRYFRKLYPHLTISLNSDIENVIHSVRSVRECVAVICGTGSVVYGYDGKSLRCVGGNGYLFDGAGSGYDIGRDLLSAALEYEDGLRKRSPLTDLVHKKLGTTVHEKLDEIYAGSAGCIASFAPLAFEAANAGDKEAKAILESNMIRLGERICHIRKQGNCGKTIIFAGGLSNRVNELEPYLRKAIGTDVQIIVPKQMPVFGAAVACAEMLGIQTEPASFDERFCKTIPEEQERETI